MTFSSEQPFNRKGITERKFLFNLLLNIELLFQFNKDSCCPHITGGVNKYFYGCVSLLSPEYVVCVSVCVISNQSTRKNPSYVSDLSELDTLLYKTHIKVLKLDMCRFIYQIWRDHRFSQRNKTIERAVGVGVGGDRDKGEGEQNLKKRGQAIQEGSS